MHFGKLRVFPYARVWMFQANEFQVNEFQVNECIKLRPSLHLYARNVEKQAKIRKLKVVWFYFYRIDGQTKSMRKRPTTICGRTLEF